MLSNSFRINSASNLNVRIAKWLKESGIHKDMKASIRIRRNDSNEPKKTIKGFKVSMEDIFWNISFTDNEQNPKLSFCTTN